MHGNTKAGQNTEGDGMAVQMSIATETLQTTTPLEIKLKWTPA